MPTKYAEYTDDDLDDDIDFHREDLEKAIRKYGEERGGHAAAGY